MEAVDVMTTAARLQAEGRPCALVTVLHAQAPTSAKPGDKAVVGADGFICGWVGGGCAQPVVLKVARRVLDDGCARQVRIVPEAVGSERECHGVLEFGMACHSGGTLELFIDPLLPQPQLIVIGASPVARALSRLAAVVGFSVFSDAEAEARDGFDPDVHFIDGDNPQAAGIRSGGYVAVATQGRHDLQGLRLALALDARYVGFVASARKTEVLKQSLCDGGTDLRAVQTIVAPAGVPIHARTPEEIALAMLAEIVATRRTTDGDAISMQPTAVSQHDEVGDTGCCHAAADPESATESVSTPATPVHSCCGEEHGLST